MSLADAYVIKSKSVSSRKENDYYPTPAIGTMALLNSHDVPRRIWEPAAGRGHISAELVRNGHSVTSSDLFDYEDPMVDIDTGVDFLTADRRDVDGVITNPPFKHNLPEKFIVRTLRDLEYPFLALFCRLTFMESMRRYEVFTAYPPTNVYVLSGRVNCHEDYFDTNHGLGGMVAYAWFVWDYRNQPPGETRLNWIKTSDSAKDL